MQERLKAILQRIKDFWLKFNKKQRTLFIIIFAAIVVTIVILAVVFSRPSKVVLRECSSESEAVQVRSLLTDNDITCTVDSGNVIRVDEADYVEAKLVLGSNNISADGYTLEDATSGGLSTTESDKQKLYKAYLETKFQKDLEAIDGVREARVNVDFPDTSNTIFAQEQDASITAQLDLTKEMSSEQAEAIGLMLATFVGSDNTKHVVVMDSNAQLLYYGGDTTGTSSTASQKVQSKFENAIIANAQQLLLSTKLYNDVTVSPNIVVNFDNVEIVEHAYTAPEGTDEGLQEHTYRVNSEGGLTDASGEAGTESNDSDTEYMIQDAAGNTQTYSLEEYSWLQDETITTTTRASGNIEFDNSSVSIVAMKTNYVYEDDARAQGLLDDMTWEEYKAANSEPVATEVDNQFVQAVSTGTGIPVANINILGYESNIFYDAEAASSSPWFVVQIILAVLIAGLLVFIIIRSTRPVAVNETEPELSVEDMLATTKAKQQESVEEIDLQDKSETRKAIEKFVDENPEAVALLLRNWLNEGWN